MSGIVEPSTIPSTSASLLQHLNTTTPSPATSSLSSLPIQLLTSPLRAFQHAETFALQTVPQTIGRITGISSFWSGAGSTAYAGSAAATHAAADMAGGGFADAVGPDGSYYVAEFLGAVKKLGGFFGYLTSLWSFACLVEVSSDSVHLSILAMLTILGAHFKPNHHLRINTATPQTWMGKACRPSIDSHSSLCLPDCGPAPWNPMSDIPVFFHNALRPA
jgi:hypothetical protein